MTLRTHASSLIAASLLLSAAPAYAAPCPTGLIYPEPDWVDKTAETASFKHEQIIALEKYMFTLQGKDADRTGIRTDGFVIVQNGQLIYEKYGRGYGAANRHPAWSVTKSVAGALAGVAVQQGALSIDDPVRKYLPTQVSASNANITIKHLMEMSSGLAWTEIYENKSNQASSVLAMLYGEGHKDMATFVGTHAARAKPGDLWNYSTGEATLLSSAVQAAMKAKGPEWEWTELFDKVGMNNVTLERDNAGNSVGGSYLFATPRDLAKFGQLYLTDGCWKGARLLPEGWVDAASSPAAAMLAGKDHVMDRGTGDDAAGRNGDIYGQLWWLNRKVPAVGQDNLPWPDIEEGAYAAEGHWGQFLIVIPSKHMVMYRTGDDRDVGPDAPPDQRLDMNKMIKLAQDVGH
jgi:CubicO group peptidase (beta-lactamase class C family)